MNVRNCKRCGKMFNYITGDPICPSCKEEREAKFQEVKKFVQDNKQATLNEIVEVCGVEAKVVKQWVREERLFFTDDSPVKINCEKCGCQIPTGRYCDKCKKDTANVFNRTSRNMEAQMSSESEQDSGGIKMHTFRE